MGEEEFGVAWWQLGGRPVVGQAQGIGPGAVVCRERDDYKIGPALRHSDSAFAGSAGSAGDRPDQQPFGLPKPQPALEAWYLPWSSLGFLQEVVS